MLTELEGGREGGMEGMVLTIQYGRMWWCFFGVVVESAKARKSGRREVSRQYVCIHIYEGHVIHRRVPLDSQHDDDDHVLSCQKERGSFLPSSLPHSTTNTTTPP